MTSDVPMWILTVDFGTTFTVTAVRAPGRAAEVIEIDGDRRMPSTVYCDEDGTILVGRAAEDRARFQPGRALRAPKARMGDKSPIILGGRPYRIVDLVAAILAHVGAEARRAMDSEPGEVRLTHPATWSRTRRASLLEAATQAALPNPVLIPEPVAAAVSYAEAARLAPGDNVLVYDLGGGTFDTAVVQATDTGFKVLGRPVGDQQVGGELFDELLTNLIGERLDPDAWESMNVAESPEWTHAASALRAESRRVKEALSSQAYADVLVNLPGGMAQQRVTRDEYENLIRPYVEESLDVVTQVLDDAELRPGDIRAIYLAGGASRTPLVSEVLAERYADIPISRRGDPKLAVALGAASDMATRSDQAIPRSPTTHESQDDAAVVAAGPVPAPEPRPAGATVVESPPAPLQQPPAPQPASAPQPLAAQGFQPSPPPAAQQPLPGPTPPQGPPPGAPPQGLLPGGTPQGPLPPGPRPLQGPPPQGPFPPGPPQPPFGPRPPAGGTPPPGRRPWVFVAIAAAVVVLLGIAAIALLGGDDGEVSTRLTDDTDDTEETDDTRETTTTEQETTTTEANTTTTRSTLVAPPPPTPGPTTAASTTTTTAAPTTPPPPPPPPDEPGASSEELAAAIPSVNDLPTPTEWVPVPDVLAVPVCEGFTGDNFPDSDRESFQVFSNTRTKQSAAGLVQAYDSDEAASNAFQAWNSLMNCPNGDSPQITALTSSTPLCNEQFYYFADYFDANGNLTLRSSIAGQRCGTNVGIWYFDETTDIDVSVSTQQVEAFFAANFVRLASLPS